MGLGPDTWGPYIWATIHYTTYGYPPYPNEEHKQKYKQFFELFQYVLPCSICREHLKDNLKEVPLTDEILSDKEKLINWSIDLHNAVNKMNGKKTYTYEEARKIIVNNDFGINKYFEMNQELEKKLRDQNNKTNTKQKSKELNENKPKENSMTTIYSLILILGVLLTIAIIYKKK